MGVLSLTCSVPPQEMLFDCEGFELASNASKKERKPFEYQKFVEVTCATPIMYWNVKSSKREK